MRKILLSALLVLLPALVGAQDRASQVPQPDGWDSDLALRQPADHNPDPHILEIDLEAVVTNMEIVPGKTTPVWTYNGLLPGPLIKLDVGDRLIVHFTNKLSADTTIHWHGLRVPNTMDGAPGFTQDPIPPGGTFTYDFVVPDAGTFWYHPHSDSAAQVGYGLYGALVVNDPADPEVFGDELVLMLSDMSIAEDGTLESPHSGGSFGDLFGREGNVLLVNGKVMPTLKMRQGKLLAALQPSARDPARRRLRPDGAQRIGRPHPADAG
jgi:FtsP/CotA-like multicopper oxidase with cupredoxin domain